jgi:hypothetical protein
VTWTSESASGNRRQKKQDDRRFGQLGQFFSVCSAQQQVSEGPTMPSGKCSPQPQSVSSRTRFPIEHTASRQPPPRALAAPKATASSRVWSRPSRRQSSVRSPRPPAAPRPRVACRSRPAVRLVSGRPKRSCENEWPAAYRRVAMGGGGGGDEELCEVPELESP